MKVRNVVTGHLKARTHNATPSMAAAPLPFRSTCSALKATKMIICGMKVRADTIVARIGIDSSLGFFEDPFQGSLKKLLATL